MEERLSLLIKGKSDFTESMINQMVSKGIKIEKKLSIQPILFVEVNDVNILSSFDFIDYYEFDETFEIQKLNILPNIRVNKLKKHNYLGTNISVAVVDTGMESDKLEIYKSVICSNSIDSSDSGIKVKQSPHGTVVGKIIKSIAPWSKIINVKVADDDGAIRKKSVLNALDWAYSNNIKIINISLGKRKNCDSACMVCNVVNQMYDEGFVIVAAIGNYGREGRGITGCPGNSKNAFTIGAVDVSRNLADYSSTGFKGMNKPDILAPGYVNVNGKEHTGTSFAAPFVTGVIAALSQTHEPQKIVEQIKSTAYSLGLAKEEQGHGLIHIENLMGVLDNERSANQN